MSGFKLTTQLSISADEIRKVKSKIASGFDGGKSGGGGTGGSAGGGGKGPRGTFTVNILLHLDKKEINKIDKVLTSEFAVRPISLNLTASRASRKIIAQDLYSYTSIRPIPINFTATNASFRNVRQKIRSGFKNGTQTGFSVPFTPQKGSLSLVRDYFERGFNKNPAKIAILASKSSLSAMRAQIKSYFANKPVQIAVTASASTKTRNAISKNAAPQFPNKFQESGAKIARSIEHYGTFTAAVGTFVSLFRAMDDAVQEAIKFDREMTRVSQVTGITVEGLKDLELEIGRVSKAYGVSSSEILSSAVTLSQAGLSAKDTKIALEAIAKTGVSATFGDINDTTEASIAIFQQFGVQASQLEGILSSVNKVSGAFAIESDDITVAVRRAGGAFKAAGGNFNEFMALFTSVRQTTRESAETIATGFRTIFARLQRTSTQNFLKTLDIDLLDEGQFVGPYEAIKRISEALKDVQTTDPRFAQIVEELGGFRQVEKVIPLLTQFTISERALTVALRGGNSLTEDAVVAQRSLEVQLNKLKQEFLDVVRTFANDTQIRAFINVIIDMSRAVLQLTKSLSSLTPVLATLGIVSSVSKISQVGKGFRKQLGFASGGTVPGQGNSDTVPAMLTPGEYVLRKAVVNKIGKARLDKLNSGDINGYNKGGVVQHFAGGGKVGTGLAIGALVLPYFSGLITSSEETKNGLDKLSSSIMQAVLQFTLFSSVMGNIKSNYSDHKVVGRFFPKYKNTSDYKKLDEQITNQTIEAYKEVETRLSKIYPKNSKEYKDKFILDTGVVEKRMENLRQESLSKGEADFNSRQEAITTKAQIAGAIASVAGSYLREVASKNIAEGGKNPYGVASATALEYAGTGASIGAILGPKGAVVGAVAGAGYGFSKALIDTTEEIKKVEISKSFSELELRLKNVLSGKLSKEGQASFISQAIINQSKLIGGLTGDARANALAPFKSDQVGIEKFFEEVARGSSSMEEFNQKTKGALSTFSALSGISYSELEGNISKIIETTKKLNERFKETSFVIKSELDSRIRLIKLEGIINSTFSQISNLDRATSSANSIFGKETNSKLDIEDVLRQASTGKFSNTQLVKSIIDNIGRNIGTFGQTDTNALKSVVDLPLKLPDILNRVYSQDKLGSKNSFIDRFSKEIDREFVGLGPEIKRSILAIVNDTIGEEGKESNLFEKIIEDMESVVGKLTKSTEPLFNSFVLFAQKIQDEESKLAESLSLYRDIVDKISDINQKYRDSERDKLDFFNSIDNRSPRLSDVTGRRNQDLQSRFNANNVNVLSRNFTESRLSLENLKLQRESAVGDKARYNALTIQITELEQAAKIASDGLSDIAYDTSGYIDSLKQLIEKTRQETSIRSDFAKTLASGSKDSKRALSRDIFNTALAAKAGSLNVIPEDERDSVIEFLRKQGSLNVFGNRADTLANDLQIKAVMQNSLGQISEELARQFVENKPVSVNEIMVELQRAYKEQIDALSVIGNNISSERDALKTAIDSSAQAIIKTLNDIQKQNETNRVQNKRMELGSAKSELEMKLAAFDRVYSITGLNPQTTGLNGAKDLLKMVNDRNTAFKNKESIRAVNSSLAGGYKDNQETQEGYLSRLEAEIKKTIPTFEFSKKLKERTASEFTRENIANDINKNIQYRTAVSGEVASGKIKALKINDEEALRATRVLSENFGKFTVDTEELSRMFNILGDTTNMSRDSLTEAIKRLTIELENTKLPGMSSGGIVTGTGNRDNQRRLLTPGEYVLRRDVVNKIGVDNLDAINNGYYSNARKKYDAYNAASEAKERRRLLEEPLKKAKFAEKTKQAQANIKSYNSFGESAALRDYKSSIYFDSLPKRSMNLKTYALNPDVEDRMKAAFHERALALQKKYAEENAARATNKGPFDNANRLNVSNSFTGNHILANYRVDESTPIANISASQKRYDAYNAQSEAREKRRLAAEPLKAAKLEERKKQVERNAKVQASRGEHPELRSMKSSMYFNSLPVKNGPRLTTYGVNPDELDRRRVAFHDKAVQLQNQYREESRIRADRVKFESINPLQARIDNGEYSATTRANSYLTPNFKPIRQRNVVNPAVQANTNQNTQQIAQQQLQQASSIDAFKEFSVKSAELATALNNFSSEITINANHKVEVIFNGAEVLSKLNNVMADIAVNETAKQLGEYAKRNGLPPVSNIIIRNETND